MPSSFEAAPQKTALFTVFALLAFAGNSIICRLALHDGEIDPASFTVIRLCTGAVVLLIIHRFSAHAGPLKHHGSWISALCLFVYALFFSLAYVTLSTGVGALILFGFVQATMISAGLWYGDRPQSSVWIGWTIAAGGIALLLLPGTEKPEMQGALMMALSGIAWGVYSVRGRNESNAVGATTSNFALSCIFVGPLIIFAYGDSKITSQGALLAMVSGALTSALGYVLWYKALEYLTAMRAALVQLSVPVIATLGGVAILAEPFTLQLLVSTTMVLGGIGLALARNRLLR